MDIDEIKTLMEAMAASDLSEMQVEKDGWTLRLIRSVPCAAPTPMPMPMPMPRAAAKEATTVAPSVAKPTAAKVVAVDTSVRSPLSGVVHLRPAPDAPPFVEAGQSVASGDVLCLVEAMKMFNEIRAERPGTVEALLVCAGEEVEAGQSLLRIA